MRKRLLAILLTSVLLGLSACGNTDTDKKQDVDNVATEESQETISTRETPQATLEAIVSPEESGEETASTEETTKTTEQTPGEVTEETETDESFLEPAGESVLVGTDRSSRSQNCHYEPELGYYLLCAHVKYDILTMKEDTYPALAKIVEDFNAKQAENAQEQSDRLIEMADEDYPEYGLTELDATYDEAYEYEKELYPIRTDKKVVSVLEREYFHEDKRGEYFYFGATNFDVQSGKELTLENIFKSGTDWSAILKTKLQEKYPAFSYDAQALAEENLIWTVGYKGVSIYFNGTDMNQPIKVSVTYDEYPDIFVKDYLPDEKELFFEEPEGDYVQLLADWDNNKTIVALDLYGDGKKDYVQFYYEDSSYTIIVNDNACFNWNNDSIYFDYLYLVKQDGQYYLYLDEWWDSDVRYLDVFEITDYSLRHISGDNMELEDFTDPNSFVVVEHVCLFVEYWMKYECHVGSDGMPTPHEEVHSIDRTHYVNDYDYISLVDITAQLVDEQGNLLGTTYTFPAGTEFSFIRTDCKTFEDAKTGDGRYCRLYIDWPSEEEDEYYYYHPTVNGMDAEACFGPLHIIN